MNSLLRKIVNGVLIVFSILDISGCKVIYVESTIGDVNYYFEKLHPDKDLENSDLSLFESDSDKLIIINFQSNSDGCLEINFPTGDSVIQEYIVDVEYQQRILGLTRNQMYESVNSSILCSDISFGKRHYFNVSCIINGINNKLKIFTHEKYDVIKLYYDHRQKKWIVHYQNYYSFC